MDDQRHHPYENLQLNIAGHAHYEYSEVARSYVPMHWHGALELIYILSGELTVETEQRRWQLHAGQCICISPYVLHATISLSGNTALLLRIPTEELGDFAPETRSRQLIWDAETTNPTMTAAIERVKQKLLQMQHTASSDSPFRDIRMASAAGNHLSALRGVFVPGDGRQHLPAREEPSAAVSGDCVHRGALSGEYRTE